MHALRAVRQSLVDLWDESLFMVASGLIGGLLSVLVVTIPLVLSAHYGATLAVSEQNVVSLRRWLEVGRLELRFFAKWFLLAGFVALVLVSNVLFYLQFEVVWSSLVAAMMAGLLLTWMLPQPFVPAFYLQGQRPRLRKALRDAAFFLAADPASVLVFWVVGALLVVPLAYFAWPLLPVLAPFMALLSNRLVRRFVQPGSKVPEEPE